MPALVVVVVLLLLGQLKAYDATKMHTPHDACGPNGETCHGTTRLDVWLRPRWCTQLFSCFILVTKTHARPSDATSSSFISPFSFCGCHPSVSLLLGCFGIGIILGKWEQLPAPQLVVQSSTWFRSMPQTAQLTGEQSMKKGLARMDQSVAWWPIHEIVLNGFGQTMKDNSFQGALDHFEQQLRSIFSSELPVVDALIVSYKVVNILTFLASKGLWNGPSVLLSPIPNACDHIDGGSWEAEWKSTMNALVSLDVGPLAVGVGTSQDEQYLIVEMMEDTELCGKKHGGALDMAGGLFEKCPTWFLRSFPGRHSWKNDVDNAHGTAMLINEIFEMNNCAAKAPAMRSNNY